MNTPALEIEDLTIVFPGAKLPAVAAVGLSVMERECFGLVGESGSGKSLTAMACLGLLPSAARISGAIRVGGVPVMGFGGAAAGGDRAASASIVFQNPSMSLNPFIRVGRQLADIIQRRRGLPRKAAFLEAAAELSRVGLPDPEMQLRKYPHQFSGGQLQRIMIAAAVACKPKLLVADEPTTALDVTIQAEIMALIKNLSVEDKLAVLFVSHDLAQVFGACARLAVMRQGRIVETGECAAIFANPKDPYTRSLVAAASPSEVKNKRHTKASASAGLVLVDNVSKTFVAGNLRIQALKNVSFSLERGQRLAIVGESGSGKSTLVQALLGLIPVDAGYITICGTNFAAVNIAEKRSVRSRIGVVYQNPYSSLNPRLTALKTVEEPFKIHTKLKAAERKAHGLELLRSVGIDEASASRYPAAFSGGQLQRIAIARAIALKPDLLILDEPTAALDVVLQRQILDVLQELHRTQGMSSIFITHNLAIVPDIADTVAVMKAGEVVEFGTVSDVFSRPRSPYTQRLLQSLPTLRFANATTPMETV